MSRRQAFLAIAVVGAVFALQPTWAQLWIPTGIIEPFRDATLSTAVSGSVSRLLKEKGDTVKRGEVILQLESSQEQLEVERRKLIADSKVELEAAESRVEALGADLESIRKIYEETQSVSEEELRKKELEFRLAEADRRRLLLAEQREDIEYQIARSQLDKRNITAPFDGVIVDLLLEEGENASPGQPAVRLVDITRCRLVVHMEASAAQELHSGMNVSVRVEQRTSPLVIPGKVELVSAVVDPSSGLQEVRVLFENRKGRVSPGTTGSLVLDGR